MRCTPAFRWPSVWPARLGIGTGAGLCGLTLLASRRNRRERRIVAASRIPSREPSRSDESGAHSMRSKRRFIAAATAGLLLLGSAALAAELVQTAEVEGATVSQVEIAQGGSANVDIRLSASGAINAGVTLDDPSTARISTGYTLGADGLFTSSAQLGATLEVFASSETSGPNRVATWDGAPTPLTQPIRISVDSSTEPGPYTLTINSEVKNDHGLRPGLEDKGFTVRVVVVEGADVCDPSYTANFLRPLEGGEVVNTFKNGRVIPVKVTLTDDCNEDAPVTPETGETVRIKLDRTALSSGATETDAVEEYAAAGSANSGSLMRWSDDGFWIYNLDTKGLGLATGSDYNLYVTVDSIETDPVILGPRR